MPKKISQDALNRLWELGLHEDKAFNDRLNFFLVFESVFLGVIASLANNATVNTLFIKIIAIIGLLITFIWGYVQAKHKFIIDDMKAQGRELLPEYSDVAKRRRKSKFPFSVTSILTYVIPALISLIWIALIVLFWQ